MRGIIGALALLGIPAAHADDGPSPVAFEPVEVTGSRIKSADIEGQVPVFTLQREDLERTGLGSVGDILQQLTTGGKALNSKFNSSGNFGYPADGGGIGAGSSQVDLRHLESKRVLVLVDGIRWVNESSASGVSGVVDLNTIPLAMVERIEVLEDGASAIYGADAIAGVINIITRRNYNGTQVNAQFGQFRQGDGETGRGDVTWGRSGARYNAVLSASYFDQREVSSSDRAIAREPVPGTGVTRGSSATPQGRFTFCDPRRTPACAPEDFLDLALDDRTVQPVYDPDNPDQPPSTYHGFTIDDRFNFAPYNLVVTPSRRYSLFGALRYQLIDGVHAYAKALYSHRRSVNRAAPEPIFLGSDAGTGGLADTISVSANQPYNPFGIDLVAGENFALLGRRPLEGGSRIFEQNVTTTYFAGGLQGHFGTDWRSWFWDLNLVKGRNQAHQKFLNSYNLRRIQLALGDPSECAAVQGCVPLDLFSGQGAGDAGTITPEMLDWVRIVTRDDSENSLVVASANLSGDLLQLPAGVLGIATGYEFRRYDGAFTPDVVRSAGESNDGLATPFSGAYNVSEAYAELRVPLLSEVALARRLDLSLAARYSHYSSFGGKTTGKVGLRWQPIDDLVLRSTYSLGFRAPFIGELSGLAVFGAPITDPCSNQVDSSDGTDSTPVETRCRALGVPDGYEQINTQILTTTGGNPELKPESARSWTAGFVYSPSWAIAPFARRLDFMGTYYRHEVDDAIRAPDAQARLEACVASGDATSAFCQGISRTSSGQINGFDNRLANIGRLETDGLDLKIAWALPEQPWGRLAASWQNTFVTHYRATDALGTDYPLRPGVEANDAAIPRWQSNLDLGWKLAAWEASWTVRHISAVTEACTDFRDNTDVSLTALGLCSIPDFEDNARSRNRLAATIYNDVRLTWRSLETLQGLALSAGANNVFDRDPPECRSCSLNGYDAGTYDAPGAFAYVQATYDF